MTDDIDKFVGHLGSGKFLVPGAGWLARYPVKHNWPWNFSMSETWIPRIAGWTGEHTQVEYSLHIRVCDAMARRIKHPGDVKNGPFTLHDQKLDQTIVQLRTSLENLLIDVTNRTVYVASEIPRVCSHPATADVFMTKGINCIDPSHLHIDEETRYFMERGHDWLADFAVVSFGKRKPLSLVVSPDCKSVSASSPSSSFTRLLDHTRIANQKAFPHLKWY